MGAPRCSPFPTWRACDRPPGWSCTHRSWPIWGRRTGELVRVVSRSGALLLPASGDFSVPPGVAVVPWNVPGACAAELIDAGEVVTDVRLEAVAQDGGRPGG